MLRSDFIPIVYEEPLFMIVDKPAGLFSQAVPGVDSLQVRLVEQLTERQKNLKQLGTEVDQSAADVDRQTQLSSADSPTAQFVGLPHRLDRGTSGIMLIARSPNALKQLNKQFQSRKVQKRYLAVVSGEVPEGELQWVDWLRKVPDQPRAELVDEKADGARKAISSVVCVHRDSGLSLLQVELLTGRTHQIRIQAASRGCPIVGDAAYGSTIAFLGTANDATAADIVPSQPHKHPPIALHALSIEFHHPRTARRLAFSVQPPSSWQMQFPNLCTEKGGRTVRTQ